MTTEPTKFYDAAHFEREKSLGRLVKRLMASIMAQADLQLTPLGLTHAQWSPLLCLISGGESTAATLSQELNLDAGALTRMLDRLETKGLCQRERSVEDRRVVKVSLTEDGQRVSAQIPAMLADVYNAHLAGFTEAEWRSLVSMLQRMIANGDALRDELKSNPQSKK